MVSRGSQTERDLDDWFAETDFAPRRPHRQVVREHDTMETHEVAADAADDWLDRDIAYDVPSPRPGGLSLNDPKLWVALAAVALLAVIGLYVGGVFNSSKHAPTTANTIPHTPTTPAKTGTTAKTATTAHKQALPTVALKRTDTGTQVKRLQRVLAALGYSPGKIDGHFGPATEKALIRFQKAKKLTADGVLGPKTLAALGSAAG